MSAWSSFVGTIIDANRCHMDDAGIHYIILPLLKRHMSCSSRRGSGHGLVLLVGRVDYCARWFGHRLTGGFPLGGLNRLRNIIWGLG